MRAVAIVVALAAGCYSPSPPRGAPCGGNGECPSGQQCIAGYCGGTEPLDGNVPLDTLVDAAPLCMTWNARHFDPCALPAPGGDLILTSAAGNFTLDTTSGMFKGRMGIDVQGVTTTTLQQLDGPEVYLLSVNNFTLEANTVLDVNGGRPLVIAVWGNAEVAGTIDIRANALFAGPGGAADTTAECPATATGNAGTTGMPSVGGGGGAFQGDGGARGGGIGGAGQSLGVPTVVRGGCAGGAGGASSGGNLGTRGAGGGALQITARESITITGVIGAGGGAGSFGRANYGGGGGGGSGGYIGLDAPSLTVTGTLAANGGSGGGGASDVAQGTAGANGANSAIAAIGGAGAAITNIGGCGKGGNGSFDSTLNGQTGSSTACGGGGGGGGAGYILFWSPAVTVTGTVSPPALSGPP